MKPVTDPNLIAELDQAASSVQPSESGALSGVPVTDPELVRDLEEQSRGFVGNLKQSALSGLETTEDAAAALAATQGALAPETAAKVIKDRRFVDPQFQRPRAVDDFGQQIDAGDYWGAVKTLVTNPSIIPYVGAEGLGTSVLPLATGAVGVGAGALTPVPGAAPVGGMIGLGTGSGAVEAGATILETMHEAGVDLNDEAAIAAALQDKALMDAALDRGVKKGIAVGAFDAASAGLAGRFLSAARNTLPSRAVASAKELGVQAAAGGAGEATGQIVTEGEVTKPSAVAFEAIGEIGGGAPEVVAGTLMRRRPAPSTGGVLPQTDAALQVAMDQADRNRAETSSETRIRMSEVESGAPEGQEIASATEGASETGQVTAQESVGPPDASAPGSATSAGRAPAPSRQTSDPEEIQLAAADVEPEPSDAKKEAGNYRKGHIAVHGMDVSIETAQGQERTGTDPNGEPWRVTMPAHYGYIRRTEGADGEQVDVYVGPRPEAQHVFVIDQIDADSRAFDEHKVMVGFEDFNDAMRTYDAGFSDGRGPERRGAVTPMTIEDFREWLESGDTRQPIGYQLEASATAEPEPEPVADDDPVQGFEQYVPGAERIVGELEDAGGGQKLTVGRLRRGLRGINPAQARRVIDRLRSQGRLTGSGLVPKKRKTPETVLDIIKSMGGIQPSGETRAMDLQKARPGLVSGRGRTTHEIREHLEQAGILPESSVDSAVYDLIDQQLKGGADVIDPNRTGEALDAQEIAQAREGETQLAEAREQLDAAVAEHGFQLTDEEMAEIAGELAGTNRDPVELIVENQERKALAVEPDLDVVSDEEAPFDDIDTRSAQDESAAASEADAEGSAEGTAGAEPDRAESGDRRDGPRRTETTEAGEQGLIEGVEPVTDRDRIAAEADKPLTSDKTQQPADEGLFDTGVRRQLDLVDDTLYSLETPVTATPAFKRWFRDSKVVDESGEPLVVYHGTDAEFEAFDTGLDQDGTFFTTNREAAEDYGDRVVGAYLSIQNPLEITEIEWGEDTALSREEAVARGHDGFIIRDHDVGGAPGEDTVFSTVGDTYIVFEPTQIKSAAGNRGTFDPSDPSMLHSLADPSPTFFSGLARGVEGLKQPKAPAQQWKAMIGKIPGVKREEIEWSGVMEWLDEQKGSIAREDLVAFLEENQVRVEEVEHSEEVQLNYGDDMAYLENFDAAVEELEKRGVARAEAVGIAEDFVEGESSTVQETKAAIQALDDPEYVIDLLTGARTIRIAYDRGDLGRSGGGAKFATYTLPGGENYRELLLTLPTSTQFDPEKVTFERIRHSVTQASVKISYDGKELGTFDDPPVLNSDTGAYETKTDEQIIDIVRRRFGGSRELGIKPLDEGQNFHGGHFEESNVLAHVRFNERTDAEGKGVLFLEEIQSDWHQKGRKRGYGSAEPLTELPDGYTVTFERSPTAAYNQWMVRDPDGQRVRGTLSADKSRSTEYALEQLNEQRNAGRVPDAPFKTNWHELAFKRMLRWAAENGFDRLAWTTGEQQADRYDLSKHLDRIEYEPTSVDGEYEITAYDPGGKQVLAEDEVGLDRIEELVGKEIAEKIGRDEGRPMTERPLRDWRVLEGLDLKVGGEGMKGFYDKILPRFANKYGKKWGAKVRPAKVRTREVRSRFDDEGIDHIEIFREQAEELLRDGHEISGFHEEAGAGDTIYPSQIEELDDYGYFWLERIQAEAAGLDKVEGSDVVEAVHALDITEAMRESVLAGQPLFAIDRPSPRRQGFTTDMEPPVFSYRNHEPLRAHADYDAAKAGNMEAAVRLVGDLVQDETLDTARQRFAGAVFAPVLAEERTGDNAIPGAMAAMYANAADGSVETEIYQANRAYHTGANAMERMIARPIFAGPVQQGARYVIVDDVTTLGGTLAEMVNHVRQNGGEVIGVITLANASRSRILAPTDARIREIERRYGDDVREIFDIDPAALTADEAQYVLNFRDADALRARATAAQRQRGDRLRAKGVPPSETEEGQLDRLDGARRGAVSDSGRLAGEIQDEVRELIGRLAPQLKRLEIVEGTVRARGVKPLVAGQYSRIQDLIRVSLAAKEPVQAARHEVIHHLRNIGMFTPSEWQALDGMARKAWMDDFDIEARYGDNYRERFGDQAEERLIEEAIADAFAQWTDGRLRPMNAVQRLFERIREFLAGMGRILSGRGVTRWEDVFGRIETGEVGSRRPIRADIEAAFESKDPARIHEALEVARKSGVGLTKQEISRALRKAGLNRLDRLYRQVPQELAEDLRPFTDDTMFALARTPRPTLTPARERVQGTAEQEAAIKAVMAVEEPKSLREHAQELVARAKEADMTAVKQRVVDQFASIEVYEKAVRGKIGDAAMSAYKMARLTQNLQSTMSAVLRHGPLQYRDGGFRVVDGFDGGFEGIFEPLAENGTLHLWKGWAAAKRAQRLIAEGREQNFSQDQIDALLPLSREFPEFETVLERWQEFNRTMLDMAEASGLINAEQREIWEKDDYVPFYRVMEEDGVTGPRNRRGIAGQRSGIKKLTGSEERIGDIIENMVLNLTHLVDASFKNVAAQRVIDMLDEGGMADGDAVTAESMDWRVAHVKPDEAAKKLQSLGVNVDKLTPDQKDAWLKLFTMVPPKDPDVISVMRDGKPVYYRVHDPLLLSSLVTMRPEGADLLMDALRVPKRWLTVGVTTMPGFMMRNFIRDTLHSWVVTGQDFIPFVDSAKGFMRSMREDPTLVSIMAAGGGSGGYYRNEAPDVRRQIDARLKGVDKRTLIDTPKKAFELWRRIGQASENANRMAVYEAAKKNGASDAEAAYQALNLLDFSMRGDARAVRFLIETIPFLNARLQGLHRMYRGARENPKVFMLRGGAIMAASLALVAANWDDERYDDLEEWEKDTYYHVFLDNLFPAAVLREMGIDAAEWHIRIPKPFEVGAIFSTVPERMVRAIAGKDELETSGKRLVAMFRDTFAVDAPQFMRPIIEQVANKTFFTDRPIVSARLQGLVPEAQYTNRTSGTARAIGDVTGLSPVRVDAFVQGYGGTIGMYLMQAVGAGIDSFSDKPPAPAWRPDRIPEIGGFVRNHPYFSTKYVTRFYELRKEASALHRTYREYRRQGRREAAAALLTKHAPKLRSHRILDRTARQLAKVGRQMQAIQDSTRMSPEKKRREMDRLQNIRNNVAKRVVQQVTAISR